jgi:putative membrane protein
VINYSLLPAVNATLNATSGVLLTTGYILIKRRHINAHRNCMLMAFASSTLFLVSYVTYHAHAGSHPFGGQGAVRLAYFSILISHIALAIVILPMAIVTLTRGLGGQYARHVKIARRTFPIWMYVSVTGVIVYLMLYQLY